MIAGIPPLAIAALVLGIVAIGVGVVTWGRVGRRPTEEPQDRQLYRGPIALAILHTAGWIQQVPREDGSVGYRARDGLEEFLESDPPGRVLPPGMAAPDGDVLSRLDGVAFEELPDGTFDSVSILVGQSPSEEEDRDPFTPVPRPMMPAPPPPAPS